ncbi:MAG: FAD-binding protein [Flavobacteriales bacterium]|nr:FAD-binding protein [Flavobacteriales bacterium]
MEYSKVTAENISAFEAIVGVKNVLSNQEALANYASDETEDLVYTPEIVLKPQSAEEISKILSLCNTKLIPVTPRGAGTGLSGGALPVYGGIVLSTENLNAILELDEKNLQITVEPGVITQVLQEAVIEKGLFYPPDPSSKGSCFIGGNVAENAGGPKAVKYGVTSDYVLNLEVVLPTGEIIWTGANVLKNSTGYNLTQLIVGSEGTLGIVTKIVLRLIPYPTRTMLMLVPFFSAEKACEAVSAVFRAGITPSGLEFMERDAIDWTLKFADDISIEVKDGIKAHLLVEVDGNHEDVLFADCEKISGIMEQYGCDEILVADSAREQDELWRLRRLVAEAVKSNSVYKEEDTVVPRAELPKLLKGVKEIGERYGFKSVCYGHAGDGNLHVNIIKGDMADDKWENELPKGIREIFKLCISLKGTLSGEHGIGLVQKGFMDIAFSEKELEIQQDIKRVFDPNSILNPGKIFMGK